MFFSLNRQFFFQEEEPQEVEDESVEEEKTEQEIPDWKSLNITSH